MKKHLIISRPRLMKRGSTGELVPEENEEPLLPFQDMKSSNASLDHYSERMEQRPGLVTPESSCNSMEADDVVFLKQQLREAQLLVKAVIGQNASVHDKHASVKAIKSFAKLQKELMGVKMELVKTSSEKAELETLYTTICLQIAQNHNTTVDVIQHQVIEARKETHHGKGIELKMKSPDVKQLRKVERTNVTLKNQVEQLTNTLAEYKREWTEERESMEVEIMTRSGEGETVEQWNRKLSVCQKRADDWQLQSDYFNSELKASQLLLHQKELEIKSLQTGKEHDQEKIADLEGQLEQIHRDKEFAKLNDLMTEHRRQEVEELQLQLRQANRKLRILESQPTINTTNTFVVRQADTPNISTVKDIRIDVLTAEVKQLKARDVVAVAALKDLRANLKSERAKVNTLTEEISSSNDKTYANVDALTMALSMERTKVKTLSAEKLDLIQRLSESTALVEQLTLKLSQEAKLEGEPPLSQEASIRPDSPTLLSSNKARAEILDLTMEIHSSKTTIEILSSELVESKHEIERLTSVIESMELSSEEQFKCSSQVSTATEVAELRHKLELKDSELLKEEQRRQVVLDEVEELRSRLEFWQTQVEDLEFERNYNQAKVQELEKILNIETKSEVELALYTKSMEWANVSTKLDHVTEVLKHTEAVKSKLEEEREISKANLVELNELWESRARINRYQEDIELNVESAAILLQERQRRITEMEFERVHFVKKATELSIELASCKSSVDELNEKLLHEEMANKEKDAIIKVSGIDVGAMIAKLKETMIVSEGKQSNSPLRQFSSKGFQSMQNLRRVSTQLALSVSDNIDFSVAPHMFNRHGDADKAAGSLVVGGATG